jgi:xanthine dehydrogenase accessory factor
MLNMNKNFSTPQTIVDQLESNKPVVLVTIVEIRGSSPRHAGAKMIVSSDDGTWGTIGGSVFEAKSIERAGEVIKTGKPEILEFEFNENTPDGMVCGGRGTVLLDYIEADQKNLELFRKWVESARAGESFYYLVQIKGREGAASVAGRSLLLRNGTLFGTIDLTPAQLETIKSEARHISDTTIIPMSDSRIVADPVKKLQTLYLIGAGHVAIPTAHIAATIGFRLEVIDDREEFANKGRFPEAERVHIIKNFKTALDGLDIDGDSYIVIMTRGHTYDQEVLEQALKTPAFYIGMISSRNKRESIYQALQTKNISRKELERVHSPIGIDIGSETPEEIAVSIAAELIKVRAGLEP